MKVAYFDCPSGAAGDMIMGALVDAGLPFETLRADLAGLRLPGFTLERREVMKGPFRATKVEVRVEAVAPAVRHRADPIAGPDGLSEETIGATLDAALARRGGTWNPDASDSGDAGRTREGHRHDAHTHRDLPTILGIIRDSDLAAPVKENASRIFARLAEAEGRVHGVPAERVEFHDVGAVDAIVDITGACIGLYRLGIEAVHCSALPIGGGMVRGPHGLMPVPGPGTAELLKGFPVVDTGVRRELVTPTGAAILTTLAASTGAMPAMTVTSVGYGAGTMDLETPNVVRVFVGETTAAAERESVVQLETTVDDMSPQLYEPLVERLFAAGALDVYLTPVLMKKSRPGVVVTALCAPGAVQALSRVCFEESTTIGVRWTTYQRQRLSREMVTLETSLGDLTYKVSRLEGRAVTVTPEFDEVRRIARDRGLPVRDTLDRARAEGRRLLS